MLKSSSHPLPSSKNPLMLLFLVLGAFLILKLANLAPKLSDEGFYFYTAKLLAEGQIPYHDFFFQHLPGQILLLAGIIKAFGYNLYLLKTIPILASLGTAIVLYLLTLKSPIAKRQAPLIAPILFLFSLSALATTDHSTGVHEAVFFLILFWYFLHNSQFIIHNSKFFVFAGVVLFLGLTYRIYILPALLGITLYYFWQNPQLRLKLGLRLLFSSLIPYVALNFGLWHTFGEKFLTPVWRYHFLKSEGIDKGKIISFFLANEWMLLVLAGAGIGALVYHKLKTKSEKLSKACCFAVKTTTKNVKLPEAALVALIAQALFLLIFADIYYFYLVTLIPFLAVIGSHALNSLTSTFQPQKSTLHPPSSIIIILAAFAALNFYNYQTNHAPVSVVTALDRIKGDVKGLTRENQTLWGSFLVTPLIALESDRKITENQVDTNAKRNYAGFLSTDEATRLAIESTLFIQTATLDTSGKILALEPDYVKQYVIQDSCTLFRTYPIPRDYEKNAILLWECKK